MPRSSLKCQTYSDGPLDCSSYNQGRMGRLPYLRNALSALRKKGKEITFGWGSNGSIKDKGAFRSRFGGWTGFQQAKMGEVGPLETI